MHESEQESMARHSGPAEWFTVPGRLLFIFTIIGCSGLFYWYFWATWESLPSGRYPILMLVFPIVLAGFVFFVTAAFFLEKCGVGIYCRATPRREMEAMPSDDDKPPSPL